MTTEQKRHTIVQNRAGKSLTWHLVSTAPAYRKPGETHCGEKLEMGDPRNRLVKGQPLTAVTCQKCKTAYNKAEYGGGVLP